MDRRRRVPAVGDGVQACSALPCEGCCRCCSCFGDACRPLLLGGLLAGGDGVCWSMFRVTCLLSARRRRPLSCSRCAIASWSVTLSSLIKDTKYRALSGT